MHTLWTLLDVLMASAGPSDTGIRHLEDVFGVPMRPVSENNYVVFYEASRPIELKDGVTIQKVDIRKFREEGKAPLIVLNLAGTCVNAKDIESHIGSLSAPEPPSHPVPNAQIQRQAQVKQRTIALGFKYDQPECLYSITLRP